MLFPLAFPGVPEKPITGLKPPLADKLCYPDRIYPRLIAGGNRYEILRATALDRRRGAAFDRNGIPSEESRSHQ